MAGFVNSWMKPETNCIPVNNRVYRLTGRSHLNGIYNYGSEGWGFESLQAHENPAGSHVRGVFTFRWSVSPNYL